MPHFTRLAKISLLLLLPIAASAHPGHADATLMQGLAHPINGVDHLLAMIAVGMWAAQRSGNMRWIAPATFIAMMFAGVLLVATGIALPFVEPLIFLSVIVLGAAIAFAWRTHAWISAAIIAVSAIFHGHAHGAEVNNLNASYIFGMLLTTLALHIAGIAIASAIKKTLSNQALRWAGASIIVGGLAFAVGA